MARVTPLNKRDAEVPAEFYDLEDAFKGGDFERAFATYQTLRVRGVLVWTLTPGIRWLK